MLELLWLLLPVAAASGWWVARSSGRSRPPRTSGIRADYFQGLNYLLNEQPDKAIEVFIRMVEVDSETVETHFALGHLFRRRGEVDRAIRIHQNLIARPTLTNEQRAQALLQLGRDYMRAGLFDRAESLFSELVERNEYIRPALRNLIAIYEQEKEWDKAVSACRQLEGQGEVSTRGTVAQYYCEQAEEARRRRDTPRAIRLAKRALNEDRACVRASLILGHIQLDNGDWRAATRLLRRVEEQDVEYIPEILAPLRTCYERLGRLSSMVEYLYELLPKYDGIAPVLELANLLEQQQGQQSAAQFLSGELANRPSVAGFRRLIELNLSRTDGTARETLQTLYGLSEQLSRDGSAYRCRDCGFVGNSLHWQCPSCKRWNSVKPVKGVAGAGPAPASSAGALLGDKPDERISRSN